MKKLLFVLVLLCAATTLACCGGDNGKKETESTMGIDYTEKNYKVSEIADKIKLTGRTEIGEDGIHLDWTWASASFHGWFDGEIRADLSLGYGTLGDIRVVIDGDFANAAVHTLEGESAARKGEVLCSVEKGEHEIALYKCTQAVNGGINIDNISFVGELGEKPADSKLKIEIIGDSISCGAGATGNGRSEIAADDSYYAYGAILSRNIPADVSVVAVSGWGLASGGNDITKTIPRLYGKTNFFRDRSVEWNFADNQPDVVIISLGTNDYIFANEGRNDVFLEKATAFLEKVRSVYPNAEIIWIYGQMLEQYNSILKYMVEEEEDPKMHYYDVVRNVAGGYGHPNAEGHEEYARFLTEKMKEIGIIEG